MVFKERFYVGYSDVNKDLRLSNTAALRFFENAACMHSNLAGDSMKTSESRWFLKGYHVKILSRPEQEEMVEARTWSRGTKGVSASREFEIYNEKGELCITALSNWVRVNAATLKPERISEALFSAYGSEPERTDFGGLWLEKLKEPEEYSFEKTVFIDRNLIDPNNHVNNVFYLDLATLALPEEIYERGEAAEFEIMYRKAVRYGETVKCLFSETEKGYFITVKSQDLSETNAVILLYK